MAERDRVGWSMTAHTGLCDSHHVSDLMLARCEGLAAEPSLENGCNGLTI